MKLWPRHGGSCGISHSATPSTNVPGPVQAGPPAADCAAARGGTQCEHGPRAARASTRRCGPRSPLIRAPRQHPWGSQSGAPVPQLNTRRAVESPASQRRPRARNMEPPLRSHRRRDAGVHARTQTGIRANRHRPHQLSELGFWRWGKREKWRKWGTIGGGG